MEEVLNVLGVVEGSGGGRGSGGLSLVSRLTWIYAWDNVLRSYIPEPSDGLCLPLKIHSLRKSGKEI